MLPISEKTLGARKDLLIWQERRRCIPTGVTHGCLYNQARIAESVCLDALDPGRPTCVGNMTTYDGDSAV